MKKFIFAIFLTAVQTPQFTLKTGTEVVLVNVVTLSNSLNVDLDFTADKNALKSVIARFDTGSNEGLGAADDATADADSSSDAAASFTPDETEYNIFNTDRRLQSLVSLAN